MKKLTGRVSWVSLATALIVVASAGAARAGETMATTVPFAFVVGDVQLPAGDYLMEVAEDAPEELWMTSVDGQESVLAVMHASASEQEPALSDFVFEESHGQHVLARVAPADRDGRELPLTATTVDPGAGHQHGDSDRVNR
jgi:hypothetical protein